MKNRTTADPLLLDRQICFSLYAGSRLLTRLYQPLLEPLGLTYPQYIVMMVVWEDAPCAVSHVAQRALLNTNTLTPLLKRLEQAGLIERQRSTSDERIVEIHLTPSGRALRKHAACVPGAFGERAAAFPLAKALQLKTLLDEMIARLAPALDKEPGP
jgi:DNA-binding MarR family transcriptional regulator